MALDPRDLALMTLRRGLKPDSSKLLDDLILETTGQPRATVVSSPNELASIFAIGTNSVYLDATAKP